MAEKRRLFSYLGYALGEIVLVVIGILLALQIDTWNKERELRKKERVYLSEIRNNLEDDLDNVTYSIAFDKRKDSVMKASLNSMLDARTDAEALFAVNRNMPVLAEFSIYTQNRVAFDNMLSDESIDLVTNDSLRLGLSKYYSEQTLTFGVQDRVRELTRMFVDHITPLLMTREFIDMALARENDFESVEDLDFRTSRVLFGDLFGMIKNLESHVVFLENYEEIIRDLIARIDRFLEKGT